MRVLFVYTRELPQSPDRPLVDFEAIQFGISFISSYLVKYGHETRLLVMTRKSELTLIDQFMDEFLPQMVCFTAVASEYLFIEKIGKYIKSRYPDKYLLAGGVHVSLMPDESMLDTFNALCIGEGEEATLELVGQLEKGNDPSGISNLWIKKGEVIEKNPTRPFLNDLDALPFADRRMWMEWIDMERSPKRPSLLLGRGCPFLCTYCCNHSLKKLADGQYVRLRSPENIISEIKEILIQLPEVKEIYFEIETFGVKPEWSLKLCSKLEYLNNQRSRPLTFGVNFRVTSNMPRTEELFAAMKKSNFKSVNIGLESGSARLRKEVLKRNYSNEDMIKAVAIAKKNGLEVVFYNLIGLLSETVSDFNETVRMNRVCLPEWNYLSIFYPYPGTDLYRSCAEKGLIPAGLLTAEKERVKAALDLPEFRRKRIQKAFLWFDYYVYQGYRPTKQLAVGVLDKYLSVYKGLSRYLVPLLITRDFFSPWLNFGWQYREYKLYFAVMPAIMNKLKNKLKFLRGRRRR